MKRTLSVVFDEISDFTNAHGTFYGVGALFEDESLLQANKKSRHEAQELRELLLQLVGIECDYYTEDKGLSKNGRQKWKLQAILDTEGGSIYGKPPANVQGAGQGTPAAERRPQAVATARPSAPPSDKDAEIRAAVALKAASNIASTPQELFALADQGIAWLKSKSSASVELSGPPLTPPEAGTSSGGEPSTSTGKGGNGSPSGTTYEWGAKGPAGWQDKWEGMGITE